MTWESCSSWRCAAKGRLGARWMNPMPSSADARRLPSQAGGAQNVLDIPSILGVLVIQLSHLGVPENGEKRSSGKSRPAGIEDSFIDGGAARIRNRAAYPACIGRAVVGRGGFALSSFAPDGAERMDSLGVEADGDESQGDILSADGCGPEGIAQSRRKFRAGSERRARCVALRAGVSHVHSSTTHQFISPLEAGRRDRGGAALAYRNAHRRQHCRRKFVEPVHRDLANPYLD